MLPVGIVKNRFDGRYHATLESDGTLSAGFEGEGATKTDAQKALHRAILEQAENTSRRAYLFADDDEHTVFCVYYSQGWGYDIVSADRPHTSGCFFRADDLHDAIKKAKTHVEQCFGGVRAIVR